MCVSSPLFIFFFLSPPSTCSWVSLVEFLSFLQHLRVCEPRVFKRISVYYKFMCASPATWYLLCIISRMSRVCGNLRRSDDIEANEEWKTQLMATYTRTHETVPSNSAGVNEQREKCEHEKSKEQKKGEWTRCKCKFSYIWFHQHNGLGYFYSHSLILDVFSAAHGYDEGRALIHVPAWLIWLRILRRWMMRAFLECRMKWLPLELIP